MFAKNKVKRNVLGPLLGFVGLSVVSGVLVAAAVTPAVAISGLTANSTLGVFNDLPSFLELGELSQRSTIYAKDSANKDVALASFYAQDRIEKGWDEISQFLKDAATSGEDPRFYEHGAIDLMGTLRALVANVIGSDVQGGSSITQQYVKNVLVQKAEGISDPVERQKAYDEATATTLERKLKEMKLAIGVEQKYSKKDILNGYLNISHFGGRIYGVEAAAEYYYSKTASTVSIAEAASLIAMVQNPNYMRIDDPDNLENNKGRRDYIINRMAELGKITPAEQKEALATPITPKITSAATGCAAAPYGAAFFCDYITWVIKNDKAFGATEDERWAAFERGGWKIYSTLDIELQKSTDENVTTYMPAVPDRGNLAAASDSIQVGTGRILSMSQSRKFSNDPDVVAQSPEYTSVNYSTDRDYGGSSGFQPGSTYKIFTVAEWLKQGHGLGEMVDGRYKELDLSKFHDSCSSPGGGMWASKNDGGEEGSILSVADAIRTSLNHAFFSMAMQLDLCEIRKTAEAFGVHRADGDPLTSNPAAIIGTNEVAPMSMAAAMAGVANDGLYCSPIAIDKIVDANGTEIEPPKSTCNQALAPDVDLGLIEGLRGPIRGGTASSSNPSDGIDHIGKTGSSDGYVHTWMLGASSKVATVVWVGNVEGLTQLSGTSVLGRTGSTVRHAIWRPIMLRADQIYGGDDWPSPDGRFLAGRNVAVPDVRGLSLADAQKLIESVNLSFENGGVIDSDLPAGTVANASITPGEQVPTATIVKVYTSNGTGKIVPNFVGLTSAKAKELADANGWKLSITTRLTDPICNTATPPVCTPVPSKVLYQSAKVGSIMSPVGHTITLIIQEPKP